LRIPRLSYESAHLYYRFNVPGDTAGWGILFSQEGHCFVDLSCLHIPGEVLHSLQNFLEVTGRIDCGRIKEFQEGRRKRGREESVCTCCRAVPLIGADLTYSVVGS